MSVGLGVVAVAAWYPITHFSGHGWTRAGGLLGLLLGVFAIFVGTLPLWFSLPNPLGTGSFG